MTYIDLRSDTVTRPSAAMRQAMANAEVGDDVFGEDPTVVKLQEKVAALLGKEKALYVPSGVMSNQLAIKAQTDPGDEIICEQDAHIFNYETAAPSLISSVQVKTLPGIRGVIKAGQLTAGNTAQGLLHAAFKNDLPGKHPQPCRRNSLSSR